jgi:hypothetical protein
VTFLGSRGKAKIKSSDLKSHGSRASKDSCCPQTNCDALASSNLCALGEWFQSRHCTEIIGWSALTVLN